MQIMTRRLPPARSGLAHGSLPTALGLALLTAWLPAPSLLAQTPGASLYLEHGCYGCHGHQGKGTHVEQANNLFPKPPVLLAGRTPFLVSEDVFRAYLRLRAEQQPQQPSVMMPHYSAEVLDDAEVSALYAHIMGFPVDEPALEDTVLGWLLEHAQAR
jgi:cytochrome c553